MISCKRFVLCFSVISMVSMVCVLSMVSMVFMLSFLSAISIFLYTQHIEKWYFYPIRIGR